MIGVYKYVDAKTKEVVYVGKSNDIRKRHCDHIYLGDISQWFGEQDYEFYVIQTDNITDAEILETAFINYYMPKYNKYKKYGYVSKFVSLDDLLDKWEMCIVNIMSREKKEKIEVPIDLVKQHLESLKNQKLYRSQIDALKKKLADFGFTHKSFGIKTINKICSDNGIFLTVKPFKEFSRRSEHYNKRYWIIEEAHRNIA